jgi:hypothetical protein
MTNRIASKNIDVKEITIQFDNIDRNMSVIFSQCSRVAYGYLIHAEEFISDVWLYNIDYAPQNLEWKIDGCEMPFRNSIEYIEKPTLRPVDSMNEVEVQWVENNNDIAAEIFIRGELLGVLQEDCKPGWAKMALIDNPIARVLNLG